MLCIWLEYLYNRGKDRRTDTHLLSSSPAEVRKNILISLFCWNMLLGWARMTRHPHCRAKQDQREHSHVVVLSVLSVLQKTQVSMELMNFPPTWTEGLSLDSTPVFLAVISFLLREMLPISYAHAYGLSIQVTDEEDISSLSTFSPREQPRFPLNSFWSLKQNRVNVLLFSS